MFRLMKKKAGKFPLSLQLHFLAQKGKYAIRRAPISCKFRTLLFRFSFQMAHNYNNCLTVIDSLD